MKTMARDSMQGMKKNNFNVWGDARVALAEKS
jgi:hypothetical protein